MLNQTEKKNLLSSYITSIGTNFFNFINELKETWKVAIRTLYFTFKGKRDKKTILKEMYEIGNRSTFFITITMGFLGMIFVYQGGVQAMRIIPDIHLLGATYFEYLIRSLAPDIGSIMLATRVGAGIAASIGSMVITDQVDALRMCSAEPVDFLIVPRFIASIIMTVILLIWGAFIAAFSGYITALVAFNQGWDTFFDFHLVKWSDLLIGLTKCFAYGAAIPIVSGYSGLQAYGGAQGVGQATTKAVVNSAITIIILNLIISALGYVIF